MPVPLNDYFGDDVQIGCELSDDNAVSFRRQRMYMHIYCRAHSKYFNDAIVDKAVVE